ncbi:MAG: Vms1/Ankzf1 family peptidyl-tRNA hydrolase [Acidimicrobiales bacterium]
MLIDDISRCYDHPGPFVSVYLETPSDDPQAAATTALRWKNLRRTLSDQGADEATLAAVDRAVGVDTDAVSPGISAAPENSPATPPPDDQAEHGGGEVLAVVAASGEVLLRRFVREVRAAGWARAAALPWVVPLLEEQQRRVPYLVALLDRLGADIWGEGRGGAPAVEEEVHGADYPIRRSAPGGWSQRRFQQRALNTWDANAREVAQRLAERARDLGAELVLVAGEEHVVSELCESLPAEISPLVRQLSSGARSEGIAGVADEVERLVRSAAAERVVALLEAFREGVGRGERATAGVETVVGALRMAMVDTLLVHDEPTDERTAWFGPDPLLLGLGPADLEALGVDAPQEARLVDVCVRAALGGGAAVRVVPGHVIDGGVGALLRAPAAAVEAGG